MFSASLLPRYGQGPSRKECGLGRRTTDGVATRSSNALQGAWPVWPTCFNLEDFGLSTAIHRKLKFISSLNPRWEESHLFSTEKNPLHQGLPAHPTELVWFQIWKITLPPTSWHMKSHRRLRSEKYVQAPRGGAGKPFFVKGQTVNILGFVGPMVLCCNYLTLPLRAKAARGDM